MAKKAKARQAAKKVATKSASRTTTKKAPAGTPRAKLNQVVKQAKQTLTGGSSTSTGGGGGAGFRKRKSAKSALKKAYEKRAFYLIRTNQLGQARKALRKKATVV
jgi:hypothetical protein